MRCAGKTSACSTASSTSAKHASKAASPPQVTDLPALRPAGITKPLRPFHDLRHTALTHEAAAGNPRAYVQDKAGRSQAAITERYIHTAQILFPGAAARREARLFAARDFED